uniref:C2 domain-containing protein n=1 Tax=Pyrodinium bahamense TaxID=73915 RepID=A0A7S0FWH2_9DINO
MTPLMAAVRAGHSDVCRFLERQHLNQPHRELPVTTGCVRVAIPSFSKDGRKRHGLRLQGGLVEDVEPEGTASLWNALCDEEGEGEALKLKISKGRRIEWCNTHTSTNPKFNDEFFNRSVKTLIFDMRLAEQQPPDVLVEVQGRATAPDDGQTNSDSDATVAAPSSEQDSEQPAASDQ